MSEPHAVAPRLRSLKLQPRSLPLRLVAPVRSRARRAPFVVVVMTVLTIGLLGIILISTVLQAQSFEIARLSTQADSLETQQQALTRDVERMQSPANVAESSIRLGMVPNANPVFLRLEDGSVIGEAEPAEPRSNVSRVDR